MHGVNLDLLRALAAYHPDGRPKDPHAHHLAEHRAVLAEESAERRASGLSRLFGLLGRLARRRKVPKPCP